jgi:hypothetical protein
MYMHKPNIKYIFFYNDWTFENTQICNINKQK